MERGRAVVGRRNAFRRATVRDDHCRVAELAFLNGLLKANRPAPAHFVLLYGRRRVGKTVLARRWTRSTDIPTIYWAAEQETAGQ